MHQGPDRRSSGERRAGDERRGASPVSYSLSKSLLEVTVVGNFTTEEALAVFGKGLASIPSGAKPGVLINATRSEAYKRLPDSERLAMLFGAYTGSLDGRIAIVVSDPMRFAISRQFGSLLARYGFEACPFEDRGAAVDWLHATG